MVNVRTENDVDRLRQVAILLQVENEKLHKELQALAQRVETLSGTPTQAVLAEVIGKLGDPKGEGSRRKSERRGRARRPKDEKIERTTHGTSPQEGLHVDEDLAELSEADCKCGDCGLPLNPMVGAFEPAEYIDIVERQFVIRRTKRQKYKKTCDCPSPIVTAPYQLPPDTLGGRYSLGLCATVAINKFIDHQPLRRQERSMERDGLDISAQVLFNCTHVLSKHLSATYDALRTDVLAADVVHIDETGWKALNARTETREMWGMASVRGAYYAILDNRSTVGARAMLGDYGGWVLSDGLKVYDKAKRLYGYKHAGCWSHARSYLVNCEENFPEVIPILDKIDELFLIERTVDAAGGDDLLARKREARHTRSRLIVNEIYEWLTQNRPSPGTALIGAANYILGQWEKLKLFLEHPELPMTNNAAERALRCGVIGRKNYLGTRSKRGELVAATLYSVLESARIRGIDPRAYLIAITRHDLAEDQREKREGEAFVRTPLLPDDFLRVTAGDLVEATAT